MRTAPIHALKHSVPAIAEALARDLAPLPVLQPNEAMIEEALALAGPEGHVALMAAFAPALASMPADVIALTRFSLSRANKPVAAANRKNIEKPMLTTPDSAVRELQRLPLRKEAA